MLACETETTEVDDRIVRAFCLSPHVDPSRGFFYETHFEHGQWWVTCRETGAQWSVCDAEGPGVIDGFCFEQVTEGEED